MTYTYEYPHPAVTVDCIIFTLDGDELKVLLIQRSNEPWKGKWAIPGGFIEMDETLEESAARELKEETGLKGVKLTQVQAFGDPGRDPRERIVTVAFYGCVAEGTKVKGADDAADARWFGVNKLPELASDHEKVLAAALAKMKADARSKPVVLDLLAEKVSKDDAQRAYAALFAEDE